jgi:serine/threonine-protein kinase
MREPDSCPDESRWRRLLVDVLDDPEREVLERHLDRCVRCRDRLEWLADEPSSPGPLGRAADRGGRAATAERSASVARQWLWPEATVESRRGTDRPPDLPGFTEVVEIGRGGMGVVYRARQTRLDRIVAVKVLSAAARLAPDAGARALNEAKALARLDHPNVVRVLDVIEHDGLPCIVMEWVGGGDLRGRLEAAHCLRARPPRWPGHWLWPCPRPTPTAWCTATSSPETCCSTGPALPG